MISLPATPELLRAARRIVWFMEPEQALENTVQLLAYAMKHSVDEDMALLFEHVGMDGLTHAIDHAPPGIIDERSWSYWNARIGRYPSPPMPKRDFSAAQLPGVTTDRG